MEIADILIINGNLFTMKGPGVGYLENGGIAIIDGKIVSVEPTEKLLKSYYSHYVIDAQDKMVIPGFIDAHIHTSQTMMRGMAQDTSNWMMKGIEPLRYHLNSTECIEASKTTVLEALSAGTTTFGEYAVPEHIDLMSEFYHNVGVRTNYAMLIYGLQKKKEHNILDLYEFDENYSEYCLMKNLEFYNKWKHKPRTTLNMGVHAPDTLSKEMLLKCKRISKEYGLKINMHVAQGDREIYQVTKRYGKRSIQFLDELGYLDEDLIAVHLTEATEDEARYVAKKGASMVVCSGSIGIIDGIVPPAHVFQESGGNVALGTDQSSGNNCNQIINEMKLTALFNKIKYKDPEIMPSWRVLRMATIEGAKVLGLDKKIGSLEEGKQADIVLIDLDCINMMPAIKKPYRNMVPNLVHSARGNEVCLVMVDGKILYKDGIFTTVDSKIILSKFKEKAKKFYDETPWGDEIKKTKGYELQKNEYL